MARYPIQLVSAAAAPRATRMDVRMTPTTTGTVVKAPAAAPVCDDLCGGVFVYGWAGQDYNPVAGNDESAILVPTGPFAIRVEYEIAQCQGHYVDFDVVADGITPTVDFRTYFDGSPFILLFGPRCEGYTGTITIQASLEGSDMCGPVVLQFGDDDCEEARDVQEGWILAGDTDCGSPTPSGDVINFPASGPWDFYLTDSVWCTEPTPLTCGATLVGVAFGFSGGDPDAYDDFTVSAWGGLKQGVRVSANGAHDYSGIQFVVQLSWDFDQPYGTAVTFVQAG